MPRITSSKAVGFAFGLLAGLSTASGARADLIPAPTGVTDGAPVQQLGWHAYGQNGFIPQTVSQLLNGNSGLGLLTAYFLLALGGLAVILLIWAGLQYLTAGGNQDKVKKARQSIINIILAIVLLVSAYTVLSLIVGTLQWLAGRI